MHHSGCWQWRINKFHSLPALNHFIEDLLEPVDFILDLFLDSRLRRSRQRSLLVDPERRIEDLVCTLLVKLSYRTYPLHIFEAKMWNSRLNKPLIGSDLGVCVERHFLILIGTLIKSGMLFSLSLGAVLLFTNS